MKKEISIIEGTKDRYSLKIDGVFIEKSDIEKIEIDKNNIILTLKLPKDLYIFK